MAVPFLKVTRRPGRSRDDAGWLSRRSTFVRWDDGDAGEHRQGGADEPGCAAALGSRPISEDTRRGETQRELTRVRRTRADAPARAGVGKAEDAPSRGGTGRRRRALAMLIGRYAAHARHANTSPVAPTAVTAMTMIIAMMAVTENWGA